jgi:hypothetical protein
MEPAHEPPPQTTTADWRMALRNGFTNWNQPLPTRTKIKLLTRNLWIRVRTRSYCCGHDGEPGC